VNVGARNDAFGAGFVAAFDADWKEQGGKVGVSIEWDPNSTNFDTQAQQLTASTPDAWVIIDFPTTWAKMGPALVRTGKWSAAKTWTNQGLNSPDLPKLAGKPATEGLNGVDPSSAGSQARKLEATFRQQNPKLPYDAFAPPNYDAVVIAFLAMLEANSSKSADIAKNMMKVTMRGAPVYTGASLAAAVKAAASGKPIDYEGPSGPLHFDKNGDPEAGTFETWSIRHGKIDQTSTFTLK
jgi:ABC-type branched-subunit amino acid transport system substrate-binding protein